MLDLCLFFASGAHSLRQLAFQPQTLNALVLPLATAAIASLQGFVMPSFVVGTHWLAIVATWFQCCRPLVGADVGICVHSHVCVVHHGCR